MLVSCHLVVHVTTCGEYVREFASQVLNWGVPEFRMAAIGNFEAVISTCE